MNGYVNPNIALQVQPVQPTNMLGTAAQAIALKAAMQDIQGGEALRNVFAQGGDINDPTVQRQIMAANPKLGGELIKKQADIRKTQIDTLKDELAIRRDALSGVTTPEDYLAWHRANHSGQMGAFLNSIGVKQKSDAELMAEISKPGGLQKAIQASALGATKLQQELMQTERSLASARISAGPGYAQAQLAREKYEDQKRYGGDLVNIEVGGVPAIGRRDITTGEIVPVMVREAPMAVTVGPNTAVNNLAPPVAQAPANALIGGATPPAAGPAAAGPAPVLPATAQTPPTPRTLQGQVASGLVMATPPQTPAQAKRAEEAQTKAEGKKTVSTLLSNLKGQYETLAKTGGITDVTKPATENISARAGASAMGQMVGQYLGTPEQTARDTIEQTRPLLMQAIKNATGMSAQQMNSNVELQTFLRAATDPQLSIQANINALNNLSKLYGLGDEFKINLKGESGKGAASTPRGGSGAKADPLGIR